MEKTKLTSKDFASAQEVKWCPGCGDYAVLAALQRTLAGLGVPRENHIFVSGIGCSSRLPYYMNTYGFHTIHGRAMAVATGIKLANPSLMVWVITGDGDALSIGGNHFIHLMRRNLDVNIILFNNQIYGLTKGQASPTSPLGARTKSSPFGSIDPPVDPVALALTCGASFVARALASDVKTLGAILEQAARHKGTSFVEVLQNCTVFNDGVFDELGSAEGRQEKVLELQDNRPLLFGGENRKGIAWQGSRPVIMQVEGEEDLKHIGVHDKTNQVMAGVLAHFSLPDFPVPLGVFYAHERQTYEQALAAQVLRAKEQMGEPRAEKLLLSGETWRVEG